MDDDFLDRLNTELHRRVDMLTEALKALAIAEASHDQETIAQAHETVWQARLALAELAFGNALRERMAQEIAPLDNQGDDPTTEHGRMIEHRRMLMGLSRLMKDIRSIGSEKLSDLVAGDTILLLEGRPGHQVLYPDGAEPDTLFDTIDLHLMRRCILRAFAECARTGAKNMREFLQSLPHAPGYDRFRDWSQRIPPRERAMATAIGAALRRGQKLSAEQQALWHEINDRDLDDLLSYLVKAPRLRRAT
jgi:hypothetical protein